VSLRDPYHHSHDFILTINAVSDVHAMTALWSILFMSAALRGIIYRVEKRYLLIEPDGLAIFLGYCPGLWLLYR
jgi:cation:H+ antiporter